MIFLPRKVPDVGFGHFFDQLIRDWIIGFPSGRYVSLWSAIGTRKPPDQNPDTDSQHERHRYPDNEHNTISALQSETGEGTKYIEREKISVCFHMYNYIWRVSSQNGLSAIFVTFLK